ncbi:unnamed protein product [Mytilus edulis]|uniref:Exonuclease domain-containing protein n=1 Tax=Mytilus edulis TaxID=6550 RepID=A0A8S3T7Q2_MYTED|nr:unnamed protein product [Mytilus edulis]
MPKRNKQGKFSKKKNFEKDKRISGLVFHRSGLLSVSDHHNISPLDSDSQNILEPDHHNSPSFDPVHNQNSELEPDHSYAKPKTIETSELCINDAFESEPNLEDHIHENIRCYTDCCNFSNNEFSSYIFPNQPISIQASEITKITVSANQMFYDLQPVSYKLPHEALTDFITFLSKYPSKPILVGHNIKRFDCHVLYYSLKANQMWNEFSSHVCGFVDTLELFKKIMPGLPSYSQTSLVSHILGENYCAHNAVDDTRALFKLLTSKALNNLDAFVFPVSHPYDCIVQQDNLKSYNEAIACKAITRATALKASKSNLKLSHLKLSIERMGLEGLKALLSEKTDRGNVRVTNCMKGHSQNI